MYACNPCAGELGIYYTPGTPTGMPGFPASNPFTNDPTSPYPSSSGGSGGIQLPDSWQEAWDLGVQAIPAVIDIYNAVAGGDEAGAACWRHYNNRPFSEPCGDTPNYDWVARAVEKMPDSDIRKLVGYLKGANDGKGPATRIALLRKDCLPFWVKALQGGKDCQASTYPQAPLWFLDIVKQYGAPETPEEMFPGSAIIAEKAKGLGMIALVGGVALILIPKLFPGS